MIQTLALMSSVLPTLCVEMVDVLSYVVVLFSVLLVNNVILLVFVRSATLQLQHAVVKTAQTPGLVLMGLNASLLAEVTSLVLVI
jgi:hypothetical protein